MSLLEYREPILFSILKSEVNFVFVILKIFNELHLFTCHLMGVLRYLVAKEISNE